MEDYYEEFTRSQERKQILSYVLGAIGIFLFLILLLTVVCVSNECYNEGGSADQARCLFEALDN